MNRLYTVMVISAGYGFVVWMGLRFWLPMADAFAIGVLADITSLQIYFLGRQILGRNLSD